MVIAGGGFGCTAVARQLAGRLPAEVDLKLTSEDSHTTFNPLLPEAVARQYSPNNLWRRCANR